jgi:preprotein translocase subunit SecE
LEGRRRSGRIGQRTFVRSAVYEEAKAQVARLNPGKFITEVRTEAAKIVWPTWRETAMTALMVVIMTGLLAIFFLGVDSALSAIVQKLLSLLG